MFSAWLSAFRNCSTTHIFLIFTNTIITWEVLVAVTHCHTLVTYGIADVGQKTHSNQFHWSILFYLTTTSNTANLI